MQTTLVASSPIKLLDWRQLFIPWSVYSAICVTRCVLIMQQATSPRFTSNRNEMQHSQGTLMHQRDRLKTLRGELKTMRGGLKIQMERLNTVGVDSRHKGSLKT